MKRKRRSINRNAHASSAECRRQFYTLPDRHFKNKRNARRESISHINARKLNSKFNEIIIQTSWNAKSCRISRSVTEYKQKLTHNARENVFDNN